MKYILQAACGCHMGKVRKNNEDNFYFDGKCLELENRGLKHPVYFEDNLSHGLAFAIFDGMGGESYGERAAYAAARQMQLTQRAATDFYIPEKKYLERLVLQLDEAVVRCQQAAGTPRMGSTMVSLYFSGRWVYVCNVGDSRAYRLRGGEFLQLSEDHADKRPEEGMAKAPLTRFLGYGSQDLLLEPHIAKGEIQPNDLYLICSDGLTDMLTNFDISNIMLNAGDPESCVRELIRAALDHGGKDNITAIVCKLITGGPAYDNANA